MVWYKYFKIFKEFSWIGIGQLFTILGALFGIRVLTTYLTTEQYGELALAMTIGTFIYTIFLGPINNGASRYFSLAIKKNDVNNYLKAVQKIIILITCLILILFFIGLGILISMGYSKLIWLAIASLSFGILSCYSNILIGLENASRNRRIVAFHNSSAIWLRYITAALFMTIFGISSTNALFGQTVAMLIILCSQICFFTNKLKNKKNLSLSNEESQIEWQSEIFSFSWPFATWSILGWMNMSADKWGLEYFSNNELVGFYSVLYQLGFYPIQIIIGLIKTYLGPIYYEKNGEGENQIKMKKLYSISFKIYYLIFLILLIPVIISFNFHEAIFKLFVDSKFHSCSYLLGPLMLSALIRNSTGILGIQFQAIDQNIKSLVLPNNIFHAIGTIIYLLGAFYGGLNGVIIASLINSTINLIWYAVLVRNQYKTIAI